jgi:pimeloyl-ACP methyl ester carboxylesterase
MAMLFAATYPERTIALTLFGTSACWNDAPDYPYRETEQEQTDFEAFQGGGTALGTKKLAREFLEESFSPPCRRSSTQAWLADHALSTRPGAVNALADDRAIDVRSTLPAIHVPTLVLAATTTATSPWRRPAGWPADPRGAVHLVPGQ